MGFGSDGYIDDGEYFESNDDGWDPQFYNDAYDPWSDPGDYGYEYSWTDQDGDVWNFNIM